VVFAGC